MTDFLWTVLASGAVSTLLTGALIFLSKTWITERLKNAIKHEYDAKLESHKAQLQAQNAIEIEGTKGRLSIETERLKSQLNITAVEHQVRFAGLHNKRAEVIAEVYRLLVQAYWDTSSFVSPMEIAGEPDKKQKYVTAMNALADFFRYFEKHRIYLPQDSCSNLEEFVREMRSKAIRFGTYIRYQDEGLPTHVYELKHEAWQNAWEYFEKEFPSARRALEKDLRDLLGSHN